MKTALQLRDGHGDAPRCELLWGEPLEVVAGPLGPILVFGPAVIVAYVLQGRRRRHLYVFRTLDVDDPLAASVPGVRPRVQLLLDLTSAGRVRLVLGLFTYLVRTGRAPSDLPDGFYVRVAAALSGRLPGHKVLPSLIESARPPVWRPNLCVGRSPTHFPVATWRDAGSVGPPSADASDEDAPNADTVVEEESS